MDPISWLMISACILCETTEQCLYRTASRAGARWKYIAPAVAIHLAAMAVWLLLLRHAPLGLVLPLTGANFVTIAVAGRLLFGERMTGRRWAGVALVIAGFALIAANSTLAA